jgi:hypothetical protein
MVAAGKFVVSKSGTTMTGSAGTPRVIVELARRYWPGAR